VTLNTLGNPVEHASLDVMNCKSLGCTPAGRVSGPCERFSIGELDLGSGRVELVDGKLNGGQASGYKKRTRYSWDAITAKVIYAYLV
jgi:hypothetical protein